MAPLHIDHATVVQRTPDLNLPLVQVDRSEIIQRSRELQQVARNRLNPATCNVVRSKTFNDAVAFHDATILQSYRASNLEPPVRERQPSKLS